MFLVGKLKETQMIAKVATSISLTFLLAACAPLPVHLAATGGSRSDGTVKVSYDMGSGRVAGQIIGKKYTEIATERCAAWGYSGAEPFDGVTKTCVNGNGYGCNIYRVTSTFQCTGKLAGFQ